MKNSGHARALLRKACLSFDDGRQCDDFPLGEVEALRAGGERGDGFTVLPYQRGNYVVGTNDGRYVELQGTAEGKPFDRASANSMLDLADEGLARLFEAQAATLATVRR